MKSSAIAAYGNHDHNYKLEEYFKSKKKKDY